MSNETLALMSRDDADELLVAQLGVFLLAAKHSETPADEYILSKAIESREARLWLLERLGFDGTPLQFTAGETLPLFENAATVIQLVNFLTKYGPRLKLIFETIVEMLNDIKGISPAPGGTQASDPNPTRVFDF